VAPQIPMLSGRGLALLCLLLASSAVVVILRARR
jgi:hypothetical protein